MPPLITPANSSYPADYLLENLKIQSPQDPDPCDRNGLASTVALFRRQHVLQRLELQHIDNRL